jgi:exosome complex protein LRP1
MAQPGPAVSSLLASLPELEASISAITERTWSDTEEELSSIDRAKLDVLAAYAINDLIWGKPRPQAFT